MLYKIFMNIVLQQNVFSNFRWKLNKGKFQENLLSVNKKEPKKSSTYLRAGGQTDRQTDGRTYTHTETDRKTNRRTDR